MTLMGSTSSRVSNYEATGEAAMIGANRQYAAKRGER
jgi:hypothetical protein